MAQGGLGKAPGTPQGVALGMLGAAPAESLNSLSWKGPSADHPVPTPSKGMDTFHKAFQQTRLLQIMTKALRPCKASR